MRLDRAPFKILGPLTKPPNVRGQRVGITKAADGH
jgi:hypothetical protein